MNTTRTQEPKLGAQSPWGRIDHVQDLGHGCWYVGTPGHGGYKLNRKRNAQIAKEWRIKGGWYEEDCDWCIPVVTRPDLYEDALVTIARQVAKNCHPEMFAAVTGDDVD